MLLSLSGKVRFFRPLSSFPFFFFFICLLPLYPFGFRFLCVDFHGGSGLLSAHTARVCGFTLLIWGLTISYVWNHGSLLILSMNSRLFCVGSPLLRGFIPLMCGLTSLMFGFMTTYVWMVNSYVWAHGSHVWIHDSFVWILMCGLPMGGSMTLICEFTILMYWFTPFIYMAPRLLCGLTTLMCGSATYM
jgi:hypothetical protein